MARPAGVAGPLSLLVAALFGIGLISCEEKGKGPEEDAPAVAGNEFAVALAGVREHFTGLNASEKSEVDSFIRFSSSRASALEVARATEIAGKGLRKAEPAIVANFVLAAGKSINDSFFRGRSDEALAALHGAIAALPQIGEIEALRYGTLIRDRSGIFVSTLERALSEVSLDVALRSRPLSMAGLHKVAEGGPEQVSGVAEILRHESLLPDGVKLSLAEELLLRGRESWPEDPVFLAALASLYTSDEDRYGARLEDLLEEATSVEPDNAAWPYLIAVRAFQKGRDREALLALREGTGRDHLTFHSLVRARRVVSCLEDLGRGPIQARLNSLVVLSDAPYFDLKMLANAAIMRSREYEEAAAQEDLDLVLQLPETMDEQFRASFHTPFAQRIRLTILQNGLARLVEYRAGREKAGVAELGKRHAEAEKQLKALRRGEEMAGGPGVWEELLERLGEEKFRHFVESVLYGNESEFLIRCASRRNLADCLPLTQEDYPF